jgi:CPA1 family monovalent cation:H+ antiporter
VGASLLAVLVVSVLLAALARRYDVSAPLALIGPRIWWPALHARR